MQRQKEHSSPDAIKLTVPPVCEVPQSDIKVKHIFTVASISPFRVRKILGYDD
jgi:hypothetical protein